MVSLLRPSTPESSTPRDSVPPAPHRLALTALYAAAAILLVIALWTLVRGMTRRVDVADDEEELRGIALLAATGGLAYAGRRVHHSRIQAAQAEALRDTERRMDLWRARFQSILESLAEGVTVHDAHGRVVSCNVRAEEILGIPAAALLSAEPAAFCRDMVDEATHPLAVADHPVVVTLRTGTPRASVVVGVRRPGQAAPRWIAVTTALLQGEGGARSGGVAATYRDVSGRYSSGVLTRTVVESLEEAVLLFDNERGIIGTNQRAQRMFDPGGNALHGHAWPPNGTTVTDGDGHPLPQDQLPWITVARTGEQRRNVRLGFRTGAGDQRWLLVSALPMLAPHSRGARRVVISASDVTESVRSDLTYRTLFESVNEGILVIDRDRRIMTANPLARALLALDTIPPTTLHPHAGIRLFDEQMREIPRDRFPSLETLRTGVPVRGRTLGFQLAPGTMQWVRMSAVPVFETPGQQPSAVILSLTDVSELFESEEKFRRITGQSAVGFFLLQDNVYQFVNDRFAAMFGYRSDEVARRDAPPALGDTAAETHFRAALANHLPPGGDDVHFSFQGQHRDGGPIALDVFASHTVFRGRPAVIGTLVDVTERRRAEADLRKLSEAVTQSSASVIITDADGTIEYVNPQFIETTGYAAAEVIGRNPRILKSGATPPLEYVQLWQTIRAGNAWRGEFRNRRKDGSLFWESAVISPIRDGAGHITHFVAVKSDITDRKRVEAAMRAALQEKEVLLKEVHHRVKNNLQVITSMLNLQDARIESGPASDALRESQNRVRAMALVHELLYSSAGFSRIRMRQYVGRLVLHMRAAYEQMRTRVEIVQDVDDCELDLDRAVPCGLICTELLSNALKHAFPGDRHGHVRIRYHVHEGMALLEVSDDGAGTPPAFELGSGSSLGLQLVTTLAHQLQGTARAESAGGARFRVTFPV